MAGEEGESNYSLPYGTIRKLRFIGLPPSNPRSGEVTPNGEKTGVFPIPAYRQAGLSFRTLAEYKTKIAPEYNPSAILIHDS